VRRAPLTPVTDRVPDLSGNTFMGRPMDRAAVRTGRSRHVLFPIEGIFVGTPGNQRTTPIHRKFAILIATGAITTGATGAVVASVAVARPGAWRPPGAVEPAAYRSAAEGVPYRSAAGRVPYLSAAEHVPYRSVVEPRASGGSPRQVEPPEPSEPVASPDPPADLPGPPREPGAGIPERSDRSGKRLALRLAPSPPDTDIEGVVTGSSLRKSLRKSHHKRAQSLRKARSKASSKARSRARGDVRDRRSCRASYYSRGVRTASGARFKPEALTAAHKTLPLGSRLRVVNRATGKSVVVRVNDRGPFIAGRCLDLSRGAMRKVGGLSAGVTRVTYEVLGRD
jgi:rare lipoprotein A